MLSLMDPRRPENGHVYLYGKCDAIDRVIAQRREDARCCQMYPDTLAYHVSVEYDVVSVDGDIVIRYVRVECVKGRWACFYANAKEQHAGGETDNGGGIVRYYLDARVGGLTDITKVVRTEEQRRARHRLARKKPSALGKRTSRGSEDPVED